MKEAAELLLLFLGFVVIGLTMRVLVLDELSPSPGIRWRALRDRCRTLEAELDVVRAENTRLTAELAKRSAYR